MSYQTAITIKSAIENIRKQKHVLPSIQREFVSDPEQIETLFDSLMRDYPISTLFWKVDKTRIQDFQFYTFLKNYHEKSGRHNQKADLGDDEDVIALLDGQQRMTSMYLALRGTYARNSLSALGERTRLSGKKYINLLKPSGDLEVEYDFKFLTAEEAKPSDGYYWFECGKILDFPDISKVMEHLMLKGLMDTSQYSQECSSFALKTLNEFFNVVHQKGTISYFLEEGEELDKVLQIFIRINSGGTKLSYSDLLLSIATAQWKEKDAREVIHDFVDKINNIGDGFTFNKDLVLKSCLVLSDFADIKFKVDNFNKANMLQIDNWDQIALSVKNQSSSWQNSVTAVIIFSTNTIIPIAYFIHKNDFAGSMLHAAQRESDRTAIKEWLPGCY